MSTPRPLGFCIRHGYGNSLHEKQDDCVNWWAEAYAAAVSKTMTVNKRTRLRKHVERERDSYIVLYNNLKTKLGKL